MIDSPVHSQHRGCLLGLAVGDALGTTLEFTTPACPAFPQKATGPHRAMTGGGPFRVAPGQVTDDTMMAACLARSLHECGRFDACDVARRYARWMQHTFDIGGQTRSALTGIEQLADPIQAGIQVWRARGRQAAGNGSLMRTAPIGVFFAEDPERRRAASIRDSLLTHADPRCVLACASFNAAIASALRLDEARPGPMHSAAQAELAPAAEALRELLDEPDCIDAAIRDLETDLGMAQILDPDLYGSGPHLTRKQGFVRVAFRLAFWELMHAEDFEEALVDVVNRGGDADTNGAIAGALLGALFGESGIPEAWRAAVLEVELPEPLGTIYHPRVLLEHWV
jgi:ADP-ribosyl-[dinitrogen reductase] hydrolase